MLNVNDIVHSYTTKAIAKDIILCNACFIINYKGKNFISLIYNIVLIYKGLTVTYNLNILKYKRYSQYISL
jgi:hypothetical protein